MTERRIDPSARAGSTLSVRAKEGGGGGFHCLMRSYPDAGIGTIVMSNATGFDVHGLLNATDAAFL